MVPTEHALHETSEITQGVNDWFETGFYIFTSHNQYRYGYGWVGDHIRQLRPIIDKQLSPWYLAFNPTLDRSLHSSSVNMMSRQGRSSVSSLERPAADHARHRSQSQSTLNIGRM